MIYDYRDSKDIAIDYYYLNINKNDTVLINPDAEYVLIYNAYRLPNRLYKTFDFNNVKNLSLSNVVIDESANIKWPKNPHSVCLRQVLGLDIDLDFSGVHNNFSVSDTSMKYVRFPKYVNELSLRCVYDIRGNVDFSGVQKLLYIENTDFSKAQVNFPTATSVRVFAQNIKGLRGIIDLRNASNVHFVNNSGDFYVRYHSGINADEATKKFLLQNNNEYIVRHNHNLSRDYKIR